MMPPPKVVVTNRKLKNNEVGIDVSVPSYEKASSPKLVKNYNVLVITRLPHFKSATHSEEDVVQFSVPRDYDSFEKLQKDMLEAFPELKLPSLPRKFHLFMKDSDIEERLFAFDCLLKVLCKDKEKCTSVVMLQFFGFDPLADKVYFKRRREYLQRMEELDKKKKEEGSTVDVEVSLFQPENGADSLDTSKLPKNYAAKSLFDDETGSDNIKAAAKVSLLEDDLFVDTELSSTGDFNQPSEHSDLLNVSESLDDVLQTVGKGKKMPSATGLSTASNSKSFGEGLFDEPDEDVDVSDMQTDDILKYIQHNTEKADEDLDLFK